MRVPQLVRSKPAPHSGLSRELTHFIPGGGGGPPAATGGAVNDAKQRARRQQDAVEEPRVKLLKAELVHPSLAALIALAVANQQRAATLVYLGLVERQRLRN